MTVERVVEQVVLTGADLTVEQVEAVARHGAVATLDEAALARMRGSRAVVDELVAEGAVVYGVTTGVGAMADRLIDPADAERLQENLLVSHAAGVGEPLPRDVVRAMCSSERTRWPSATRARGQPWRSGCWTSSGSASTR